MTADDLSGDSRRLVAEGSAALADLFELYRDRLLRTISFRLDQRLRGRIDPMDVLQEAFLQISQRLADYRRQPTVSCFVWMRQQTLQTLIDLQRGQFREKRSPGREVQFSGSPAGDGTSVAIASFLVAEMTSPSGAVMRAEEAEQIQHALATMQELDREVLALRHFELLGNQEVAETLGLSATAASNRYVRAMARLSEILAQLELGPGNEGP